MLAGVVGTVAVEKYPYDFQTDNLIREILSTTKTVEQALTGSDSLFMSIHTQTFQTYALTFAAFYKSFRNK